MSIFGKWRRTFVFLLFEIFKKWVCEHYGKNGKKIIPSYAVKGIVHNSADPTCVCRFYLDLPDKKRRFNSCFPPVKIVLWPFLIFNSGYNLIYCLLLNLYDSMRRFFVQIKSVNVQKVCWNWTFSNAHSLRNDHCDHVFYFFGSIVGNC